MSKKTLTAEAAADARRILDAAARRILATKLAREIEDQS